MLCITCPLGSLEVVSAHLGVPGVEVESTAHSYSELRLEPPPALDMHVCVGLSCWLRGSSRLLERLRQATAGADHGSVGIEEIDCAFMCGVAPVVVVNGAYVGQVDEQMAASLVAPRSRGQ